MALPLYLAMTASEMARCSTLPEHAAWMACHFSLSGPGIQNCPEALPSGAMVILDDSIPLQGHDPKLVAQQLTQLVTTTGAASVLLDFQRPGCPEMPQVVQAILDQAGCPVGVTELYAAQFPCPVFLSPPPLRQPLSQYLAPWKGREIWLEAALDGEQILVDTQGSRHSPCVPDETLTPWHTDASLFCRYHISVCPTLATFTLWRTRQELDALLLQAQTLGVTKAVGLYQELGIGN